MKKMILLISLFCSIGVSFGQKAGEGEFYFSFPPLLTDQDSVISSSIFGYSSGKYYFSIWFDGSLFFEKEVSQNEYFEVELPAKFLNRSLSVYSDKPGGVPESFRKENNNLYIFSHIGINLIIRIQTKYSTFYSEINQYQGDYGGNIGKEYKISSSKNLMTKNNSNSYPFVNIMGVFDKTKLTFYVGGDSNTLIKYREKLYKYGDIIKDTLNRGDYIVITSYGENSDLTGSMVRGNKPITVSTGNTYSFIGDDYKNQGLLYNSELTILGYSSKYYIPELRNNGHNPIVRIFAKDSANVYAGDSLIGKIKHQFGSKDSAWIEYKIEENKPITIWGDRPINVVSYSTGIIENNINNPIQMNISSNQMSYYANLMYIPDLKIANQKDYATFIVLSDSAGNIPQDMKFEITLNDGKKLNKKINDFSILNLKEIYDPYFAKSKFKILTFSIELERGYAYITRCSNAFQIYINGFNDEFNYMYNKEHSYIDLEILDTLCPEPHYRLNGSGICYRAETYVVDRPQDDAEVRSNMGYIQLDKKNSYNFTYHCDDFVPGETDSINWYVDVMDMTLDARAVITFTDRAGYDTTIIVEYKARKMDMSQTHFNFGYVPIGQSQTQKFTMKNEADFDFQFRTISFGRYPYFHERKGFKLNFLFDTTKFILPNQSVDFEVTFAPTESGVFRDTLYLSDTTCYSDIKLIVAGNSDGTSVMENENETIISPNPATDYITLNIPPLEKRGLGGVLEEIRIFDIFGNEMHPPRPSGTPQEGNKYRIDISSLPAGVYFVRIGNEKPIKFVKL